MNILKIENLSKTYSNGVKAMDDIDLTIQNGMFGLLGANGAGKSSLMRTIAALQKPSEGSIYFNDQNIIDSPEGVRSCLGYLPQVFDVYPKITALSLLHHLAILKGITHKKERNEQVEMLLQQTNLYQHRKKYVSTFSGGMKQRFGIAQALLGSPKLIIVDEPTAGLDPEERNRFLNLLSEIGENVIVILSTHIVEDIQELCQRMAILADGKILVHGTPSTLIDTIQNKVWSKIIQRAELSDYTKKFKVISTKLVAGETQIRILAEHQHEGFNSVSPGLEDFYFSQMYTHKNN